MASGTRMCWIQLFLKKFFAVSILISLTDGSPLEVMSAPSLLQAGTAENIFVEIQDYELENDIPVQISVVNYPTKRKHLAITSLILSKISNYQGFGRIKIPAEDFSNDPDIKQYVYLQARFPDRVLEKVVLVSFHSGSIFIQTDKNIYTQDSEVLYRIFAVTPGMEPVTHKDQNDVTVDVKIVTPEGIALPQDPISLRSGIANGSYILPEIFSYGLWKVVTNFHSNPQETFAAEFEVKEHVTPSFEVELTPASTFFYIDSDALKVHIKASYSFGQNVVGTAYAVFGVMQGNLQKRSFPSSIQRVAIVDGKGVVTLKREHITQTFPNINELTGSFIFVAVSVLTESGGEMVEAELKDIKITPSPYTLHLQSSSRYFKPGMPYDVMIEVVNPDNSPAQGVAVVVDPDNVPGFTSTSGVAKVTINTAVRTETMTITVKTNDPLLPPQRQASASMTAHSYKSKSNNVLVIYVVKTEVELGGFMEVKLLLSRQESQAKDITFLILSRGQLVKHGRYHIRGETLISQTLPITKDMLPSFRFIAYYHTNSDEVISDSVWVDVKDSCISSLKLESERPASSYKPHSTFGLKITGDPQATVGLVAVDKSTYVLNKLHLTQKKIWNTMEKYDTGCTPGGGKDSMSVFYDAGLLFETKDFGTPDRTDFKCPAFSRRKRDTTAMDVTSSLGADDNGYMDSNEIIFRTRFHKSWLWMETVLGPCPQGNSACASTSLVKNVHLPETVTTWLFTGISLSPTHGICVSDPLEVKTYKNFFIDLRLPYSAVRGEQLEIKAIVHNYSPDPITVRVQLREEASLCSAAYRHGWHHQIVSLGAQTTLSVLFIIIPMKEGYFPVHVNAAVKDSTLNDGIEKMLRVVPAGIPVKSVKTVILNPAQNGIDGKQVITISSQIPPADVVPDTPVSTVIFLTGGKMSPLLEEVMSGDSMDVLIIEPSGLGEENMIRMTLPVSAVMFLDQTNQWETVGFKKRDKALQYILKGYQNELAYRKADGSFSGLTSNQGSTWLTAYVAKVFSMVHNLVEVQPSVICDAIKFLILTAQGPNGMFTENGKVFHIVMTGDVTGTDSAASMTAFCLIALQESRSICSATVNMMPSSINRAVTYLEQHLPSLTNPYAVAMTSYALANENKLKKRILFKFAAPDRSHWPSVRGGAYTLETTAYALRALVKAEAFVEAKPVVKWLSQQQRFNGGFGSTQATLTVYQAVAEYWTRAKNTEYGLNVEILLPGRARPYKYLFNRENQHTTQMSKFNDINNDVLVTATGTGDATLKMLSLYYAMPINQEAGCEKFDLNLDLKPVKIEENQGIYKLTIQILYKSKDKNSSMTVLDIGLPTGYTFNQHDLDALSSGKYPLISKYETDRLLSEKGSLMIYLNSVTNTRPEEVAFRIEQTMKVGVLQPAAVSVYEYYDRKHCVKYYHPERKSGELLRLCTRDECICVEENCSKQKKEKIDNYQRINKACESSSTSKIDFVYKVKVENFSDGLNIDIYRMRVLNDIKVGSKDQAPLGQLRTFLSYQHCREALDLRVGKDFLIMGSSSDIHKDENNAYQYVLGGSSWIEYWPTDNECQTEQYRPACVGMEELQEQIEIFGCQMK